MKNTLLYSLLFISLFCSSQTYPSFNINLVGLIHPNTGTVGIGSDDRRYSGCWGWKHPGNNKEFAIVGGSSGTYFIDISTPSTPSVSAYVPGKPGCTWREIQTYQNYAYIVSDDASPNTFQIVDMTNLPSTVTVVHDGVTYFERGHTIFIENDRMYIGSVTYTAGNNPAYSSMNVYSISNPTVPFLLKRLEQDYPAINTVHDMHVVNDTVYASCGFQGLHIYYFLTSTQTFTQLGSYTNYAGTPYNHSSSRTANGDYLVFCDEVPTSLPIKLVDVQNPSNVQPMSTFNPAPLTTPHNPYVVGNNYLFVSCYQDGLNMYNISSPAAPYGVGFFDTHPQGGANVGNYFGAEYRGNWGAYPYLPSGIVIAVDMQNGVFLLDPSAGFLSNGISRTDPELADLNLYPNPVSEKLAVSFNSNSSCSLRICNMLGETVLEKKYEGSINEYIYVDHLPGGTYLAELNSENKHIIKKISINH